MYSCVRLSFAEFTSQLNLITTKLVPEKKFIDFLYDFNNLVYMSTLSNMYCQN